jgi:hypothetical protein
MPLDRDQPEANTVPNKAQAGKNFFHDHVIITISFGITLGGQLRANMLFSTVLFLAGLVGLTNAHFQLQFPIPRGNFDEDNEPKFCGQQHHWVSELVVH